MTRSLPLVKIPSKAAVYRFGTPTSAPRSSALLRFPSQGWTINRDTATPEGWAIVGDADGRKLAVETLLSRHRIQPLTPPPGPFPYVSSILKPASTSPTSSLEAVSKPIRHLALAKPPTTGEFTDFTARYGHLLEEDKLSYKETLLNLHPKPSVDEINQVAKLMGIHHLLDLPSVSFSSGQTRRGRIASALLTKPVLLMLEDPMAGLDIPSRKEISNLLGELNAKGDIKFVLVLRGKGGEEMPGWITDVAEIRGGDVWIGKRDEYDARSATREANKLAKNEDVTEESDRTDGEPVVALRDVSLSYGEGTRPVLRDVNWTIRPGEKWHLVGANGSGKTTLLSIILGHHPRSFSLPASALQLFSKPRRSIPSPILRTMIGHTSPEIYASFPRGMGMTAMDAVGSGFEGIFSRRDLAPEQEDRVRYLIEYFEDLLRPSSPSGKVAPTLTVDQLIKRQFSHFTPPQQGLLLFLRAIVSRPRLLILDEPSQGVDEKIWERCRGLLEEEWKGEGRETAVIVVSHYEDEVPWKKGRGKVFKLDQGVASIE